MVLPKKAKKPDGTGLLSTIYSKFVLHSMQGSFQPTPGGPTMAMMTGGGSLIIVRCMVDEGDMKEFDYA
jgi:hypothetical protein